MAKVTLQHVDKVYPGGVKAVSDFNLEITDGEFVVLVGPSGCGKSTTLRMVAGLEEISRGVVQIGDRVVNDVPPKDRDIAMVFQNYALYPHMTVYDNMAFGLKLRKYPKKEIDQRIREAARILGLDQLLERRPKALSGGQRQRVAVGRAIVRKPAVFLFDEPLSNLDAKLRVQMRVEINQLHAQLNATMIYVTHDQTEAMTMGDRIVVMRDGLVLQVADPLTLYDDPADMFVAGFIGTPAMNFVPGRITGAGDTLRFSAEGCIEMPIPASLRQGLSAFRDKAVTFGIRPEDIGSARAIENKSSPKLRARVDVIEPMGCEAYVHLSAGTARLVARTDPYHVFHTGESIELPLYSEKARFFDPATEKRIR
ncbi:MAG: sn-glycerol-3-phosphate ABC transporter ATP-binding protein UgpC [Verrucomicrobia bacterium]|nr:sn-glycerol-3-phosphate ABC transporter ATP-binding protein UgpC [Verrucomicrobiota bacterium]